MAEAKTAAGNIHVPGRINRDKCFTLLVIDDANTGMYRDTFYFFSIFQFYFTAPPKKMPKSHPIIEHILIFL